MRPGTLRHLLVLAVATVCAAMAHAQTDRRDRQFPELVLETGGRTGTCDGLFFTPDARRLYAVGDDKVVRFWKVGADSLEPAEVLRWSSWREQRGAIYAVALSPDGTRVAVGGWGIRTGTVAVIERATGKVEAALLEPQDDQVVRAIAFTPDGAAVVFGTEVGNVWHWKPGEKTARRLARHKEIPGREFNRVRLLAWPDGKRLLSAAESGEVLDLDPTGKREPRPWLHLKPKPGVRFYRVILSPDSKWLAAAPLNSPFVAIRALADDMPARDIDLGAGEHVRSIAFNPTGAYLAVGIGAMKARKTDFLIPGDDRIAIYSPSTNSLNAELKPGYHAEAIAFHPDGERLAVAGGADHDVTLWHLARPEKPLARAAGLGRCLWDVALSKDGRQLGFRDTRDADPPGPNRRGAGSWRVFDLEQIAMAPGTKFEPTRSPESVGGWTVAPEPNDPNVWYAVAPDGTKHPLRLDPGRDQMPQCYAFLNGNPPRLVVGHYWGLSVFELSQKGVRRSRLYTGHQALVTALAVSADGKWLVSASRDQTVAGWSLAGWQHHPELGASFEEKDGRLFVKAVDGAGGPAWEAGLLAGDEVLTLVVDVKDIAYNRERFEMRGRTFAPSGGVSAAAAALAANEPGKELYFRLRRGGRVVNALTTVRQRPLWRFFPAANEEWVLWMWRFPYYSTSTNGDALIGWLVNDRDLDRSPAFYRLDQFRNHYQQDTVIEKLLTTRSARDAVADQGQFSFDRIEPPAVRLTSDTSEAGDAGATLTLVADPRGENPDQAPQRVELWLNDYRLKTWDAGGKAFRERFTVGRELFRAGRNELTMQVYTRGEGGREARAEVVRSINGPKTPSQGKVHGVFVGVNDYTRARLLDNSPPKSLQFASLDADALHESWRRQTEDAEQFAPGQMRLLIEKLPGKERTAPPERGEIVAALRGVAKAAGPDDLVIVFLSGHGDLQGPEKDFRSFVFCPPAFRQADPERTGLTSKALADELAAIKGRKVVLLDTCRSGGILNPIRALTPGGRGPSILASCDRNQLSYEDKFSEHGLFTRAVLEALDGKAGHQPGQAITTRDLQRWLRKRVPELVRKLDRNASQTPIGFPSELEDLKLARRRPEAAAPPAKEE